MTIATSGERGGVVPSYRDRLGSVGRHLDALGFRSLVIVEFADGLLVRANRSGTRLPEVIEIVDADTTLLDEPAARSSDGRRRLFPSGYGPFLEALGERLDSAGAGAISIVEGNDFVVVGGIQPTRCGAGERQYEALDVLLLAGDIETLVARATPGEATTSSLPLARGGRPTARSEVAKRGRLRNAPKLLERVAMRLRSPLPRSRS